MMLRLAPLPLSFTNSHGSAHPVEPFARDTSQAELRTLSLVVRLAKRESGDGCGAELLFRFFYFAVILRFFGGLRFSFRFIRSFLLTVVFLASSRFARDCDIGRLA